MYRGNIRENIEKLSKLGYEGVEISLRDPKIIKKEELKEALKKNSMTLTTLGTGQADASEVITFINPDKTVRKAAVNRIKEHIDLASEFNSFVITGLIRGNLPVKFCFRFFDKLGCI